MDGDFRIGDWLVQPNLNRIVQDDREVRVEPKAMEVLAYLTGNAGSVVPKSKIIQHVWSGSYVTEEVLTNSIWELRKALGDDARDPSYIQTVPRRGYRLIATVHRESDAEGKGVSTLPTTSGFVDPRRAVSNADVWNTVSFWRAGHDHDETALKRKSFGLLALAAGGTAVAIGVGFALLSNWSPFAPPSAGNPSIAIMDFENHIDSEEYGWLSKGVCRMLQGGLDGAPELDVVSDEKLKEVVREIGQEEETDELDASFFPEIARRAGAETFLAGSIVKHGEEIRIDAQLEDVADGSILSAYTVRGTDLFQIVDDLAWRMGQALELEEPLPKTKVSGVTKSLEAYRLYGQGMDAGQHLRLSDAHRLFLEAVAVDPAFGLAYWQLHKVALVRHDTFAAAKYLQQSLSHHHTLPERQKILAEAGQLVQEHELEKAVVRLEEILARYPREEYAYVLLAIVHLTSSRPDEGLAVLASGIEAVPGSGLLRSYYGYGMLQNGRYPEAFRQFESYAQMYPDDANPYERLGEAYLVAGMPDRALEEYLRAPGGNGSLASSSFGRSWASAMMGRYDEALAHLDHPGHDPSESAPSLLFVQAFLLSRVGRYREAERYLLDGIRVARRVRHPPLEARSQILRSMLALERGDSVEAIRRADQALDLLPDLSGTGRREILMLTSFSAGLAQARDGRFENASRNLDSMRALYNVKNPRENWWYHSLQGEIALASGDLRAAEVAFSDGEPDVKMWFSSTDVFGSIVANVALRDGAARTKAQQGDLPGAIRMYRKLLTPDITQRWTGVLEPLHVLELARLLAQQGNLVAARQQYEKFLALWNQADTDSPNSAEARQFLAE